jgi:DNA-binding transcriptional LysR family regulator
MTAARPDRPGDTLWAQVYLLNVIAQVGSLTLAAQRLGVSKASVSQRLALLERSVGATLVQRTTRSLRLTDAGRQLVDDTAESFDRITRGVHAVRELAGQPRGLIRLTAPVALGRQQIVPALEPFLRAYPEIRIDLDLSDRLAALAREGFDLAVRHTSVPPESHVAWKLCESRSLLVAAATYLRRRGTPEHPSELGAHECLPYLRPGQATWLFERAGRSRGDEPERVGVAVNGPLRANNSEVVRGAVLAGLGIGLLPDFSAADALRAGRLRLLLPQWSVVNFFGNAVYAIHPWSATTPRPVRLLVEHLRASLAAGFGP